MNKSKGKEITSRDIKKEETLLEKMFAEIMPEVKFINVTPREDGSSVPNFYQRREK